MTEYLVQHYLDNSRRLAPYKISIRFGDRSMTYEDLYVASNKLAHCLIANGVSRQDRVVFCLRRSPSCIVSMLGILKADAIYVPIDRKTPSKRFRIIIEDCQPKILICDSETVHGMLDALSGMASLPKLILLGGDEQKSDLWPLEIIGQKRIDEQDSRSLDYKNLDSDIAYILYTSGSTGKPKGVMISHLNINNYIQWAVNCFSITRDDNILSTAPFHFDMSTFDIYCALKTCATLCIAPEIHLLFPSKLMSLIEEQKVTIWKAISSLIMYLSKTGSLKPGRISSLRKLLFSGEVLSTKHLIKWMETYPNKEYYNCYGPTEATGISTYHFVEGIPKDSKVPIPIGRPCSNTDILLLTEDDSPADVGEVGEICIRGSGLSVGYWNDGDKTNSVFVANPVSKTPGDRICRSGDLVRVSEDGTLEFIGRKDFQVKYMGFRIELSEIEKAISGLDGITDTAVILSDANTVNVPELVAFVETEADITSAKILSELGEILPPYMLPKQIYFLQEIPRTDRGKIDRLALEQHYSRHQLEKC